MFDCIIRNVHPGFNDENYQCICKDIRVAKTRSLPALQVQVQLYDGTCNSIIQLFYVICTREKSGVGHWK